MYRLFFLSSSTSCLEYRDFRTGSLSTTGHSTAAQTQSHSQALAQLWLWSCSVSLLSLRAQGHLRLPLCAPQPGSLEKRIDFFFPSQKRPAGCWKAKASKASSCCCLGCFWLRDICLPLSKRCFSFHFPDGPSFQKEKSASGFVRHRNCFFHRVLWLNSCSSATYQWLMLAILPRKLIFIYL